MPLESSPNFTPQADGVYLYQKPPVVAPLPNATSNVVAFDGTGAWFTPNTPISFGSEAELYDAFGRMTSDPHSLVTEAYCVLDQANTIVASRVTDGTDTPAQISITDATGAVMALLTAACSGSRPTPPTGTPAQASLSPSALSTASAPLWRLVTSMPDSNPESWDGLVGYKMVAGVATPDTPTLNASIAAAVNRGYNGRPASAYWLSTAGGATGAPVAGTFLPTIVGTDGALGVTEAMMIGADGDSGRTGLYALRGSGADTVFCSGCYGPAVAAAVDAFVKSELAYGLANVGPSGTTTNAAVATKQTNNIASTSLSLCIDWVGMNDPNTQQPRTVSPLGFIAGEISSLLPEQSPGNKPVNGFSPRLLYTERSQGGQPISGFGNGGGEIGKRASAGLLYITNQLAGSNGLFKVAHGQNTSGIPGLDGINSTRMTNLLTRGIFSIVGPYVDGLQSADPNDPLRTTVGDALRQWLGTFKTAKRIVDYSVDDGSGNTQATVVAGFAYVLIQVQYLGVARFFIPTFQGGTSVVIAAPTRILALQAAAA